MRVDRNGRVVGAGRRALPGVALLVVAWLVAALGADEQPGPVVQPAYGHDMLDIVGPWWLASLSTALAHPVMWLAVLAGVGGLLVVAWRDGPRAAVAGGAVWLGANLTVQAVKHVGVAGVGALQLSGHTAVASGAALLVVLAVPPGRRRRAWALAAAAVVLVGVGVVLVGWHTPVEAAVPALLTCAWAALLRPWVARGRGVARDPHLVAPVGPPVAGPPDGT